MQIAENSDDSIYESSYQNIDKAQHPSLRASKLTKRIKKDKYLTPAKRNALKARRNIITHRTRKKRVETEAELLNRVIPALQRTVSLTIYQVDPGHFYSSRSKAKRSIPSKYLTCHRASMESRVILVCLRPRSKLHRKQFLHRTPPHNSDSQSIGFSGAIRAYSINGFIFI